MNSNYQQNYQQQPVQQPVRTGVCDKINTLWQVNKPCFVLLALGLLLLLLGLIFLILWFTVLRPHPVVSTPSGPSYIAPSITPPITSTITSTGGSGSNLGSNSGNSNSWNTGSTGRPRSAAAADDVSN